MLIENTQTAAEQKQFFLWWTAANFLCKSNVGLEFKAISCITTTRIYMSKTNTSCSTTQNSNTIFSRCNFTL